MSTTKEDFLAVANAIENNNVEDLKKLLQSFDITTTDKDGWSDHSLGWSSLHHASCYSSSPEVVTLVLDKIVEVGGSDLLKSQLTAISRGSWTCLMLACGNSSSPEVVKLIFDKIVEVGGYDLLKSQLTAENPSGDTCLMVGCRWSTPEVIQVIIENMFTLGRPFLKNLLNEGSCKYGGLLLLVLSRRSLSLDSFRECKLLFLIVSLYSITGLFANHYLCLHLDSRDMLSRICKIESGAWSRATSNDSTMGDVIGEIKKSIKDKSR